MHCHLHRVMSRRRARRRTIFSIEDLLPGDLDGVVKRGWVELTKRLWTLYNTVQDGGEMDVESSKK